jgi:hypothetical protein
VYSRLQNQFMQQAGFRGRRGNGHSKSIAQGQFDPRLGNSPKSDLTGKSAH